METLQITVYIDLSYFSALYLSPFSASVINCIYSSNTIPTLRIELNDFQSKNELNFVGSAEV